MSYHDKYLKYKSKYLKLKKVENKIKMVGGSNNKNTLYLFKADWCGHCKALKPTWDKLQNELTESISFKVYDSDKDNQIMKDYKIGGFPTIILKINDKTIEYVGPRDYDSLKNFILQYNK